MSEIKSVANATKYAQEKLKERLAINGVLLENGVEFIDITAAYIENTVKIGKGTKIYPGVVIEGHTEIGENCIIGMNTRIKDSKVDNGVEIQSSVIIDSHVGDETTVGPFAYLRPGSNVGKKCKIGDFVEVKNSNFGDGSKSSHLTYIGDSDVGKNVNIGCGVVFVNYDGKNKFRSTVGDGSFVGCNTNLVSPVNIDENVYIAAGSTVVEDIPKGSLYVARSRGKTIPGWVDKKGLLKDRNKK